MSSGFLPNGDTQLLAWSANFSAGISANPVPLGLTAAIATAYAGLHASYATALGLCDPGQRCKSNVAAKNVAREALKAQARLLAKIIQGQATVTDAQKLDLGLSVRSAPQPRPIPDFAPALSVVSVSGTTAKVKVAGPVAGRRGLPTDVDGYALFSFTGETPPDDTAGWKFEANLTRTTVDVVFPSTLAPGTKVWFTSFFFNERKQSGPAAPAISTYLPGGAAMAA